MGKGRRKSSVLIRQEKIQVFLNLLNIKMQLRYLLKWLGCQHQWAQDPAFNDCGQTQPADQEGHREDRAGRVPYRHLPGIQTWIIVDILLFLVRILNLTWKRTGKRWQSSLWMINWTLWGKILYTANIWWEIQQCSETERGALCTKTYKKCAAKGLEVDLTTIMVNSRSVSRWLDK